MCARSVIAASGMPLQASKALSSRLPKATMRSVFDTGSSTGSDTSARTGTPLVCASCTRVYKNASTTGLRQAPRRELYVCAGSSCSEYSEAACRLPACKSAWMVFRWWAMSWRMARICSYCAVRSR